MCDFPAVQLLKYRRDVAESADRIRDPARLRLYCEMVRTIDQCRLAHAELTRCTCWQEAINAPAVPEKKPKPQPKAMETAA